MRKTIIFPSVFVLLAAFMAACGIFKPARSTPRTDEPSPTPAPDTMKLPSPEPGPVPAGKTDAFLDDLLRRHPQYFGAITGNKAQYQAQIIYTRINRNANNQPSFEHFHWHADAGHYFYPASVVKMPLAFLALQRINELRENGIAIDRNSAMITETAGHRQTAVYNDPTTPDGLPSVAHYIKKIFLVSDNDASNRLYEFLGQNYINSTLQRMGYKHTEILHRLSVSLSEEENRHTNPVVFYDSTGRVLYRQEAQHNTRKYSKRNDRRGNGFLSGGVLVNQPFDFSKKNRLALEDMHQMLMAVLFPEQTPAAKRFKLSEDDCRFLYQYMSQLPSETRYPSYTLPDYWDAYVKFNLFGSEKTAVPKHIRLFNKVGEAYGYLTDVSYIVDFETKTEFMLSATIYVNKDGIFNDDKYEYDAEGFPFFKHLGRVLYDYEKQRTRKHIPDLSKFRVTYDQ